MEKGFKIKIIVEFNGAKIEKEVDNHHIANMDCIAAALCQDINKDLHKKYSKENDNHPWYYL